MTGISGRFLGLVGATTLLFGACQDESSMPTRDSDTETYKTAVDVVGTYVVDYCTYGAVSVEQLSGCLQHVSAADIERLDTPAASYAASGSGSIECGDGAGPFCGPGDAQDRALRKALEIR